MGKEKYPGAKKILIMADGGGSNSSRSRLWKAAIQKLANKLEFPINISAVNSLGDGLHHVSMSPNPESLWSDEDDPASNYPKNYLKRNLEKLDTKADSKIYTEIAKNTDIEVLKHRYPESFGQFYTNMQSFIAEENVP
jgi:hypothetical protein